MPENLIAKYPPKKRENSRLFVVDRKSEKSEHRQFSDLPDFFGENDFLVFNQTKVVPARIKIEKKEIFLGEKISEKKWKCLTRPGKKFQKNAEIFFPDGSTARVLKIDADGLREIEFFPKKTFAEFLNENGEIPLPPYLKRDAENLDKTRYQTIYAEKAGSVAAPTAGLHFSDEIFERLKNRGVEMAFLTLHVGLGTFLPVKTENLENHQMHFEHFEISEGVAAKITAAKKAGKKITAVGSTSLRALEAAFDGDKIKSGAQKTNLFLYPPANFRVVDHFLTNFHLPRSTLLMLLSAFFSPGKTDGRKKVLEKYAEAIAEKYRFFSYGDASLWL